MNIVRKPESQRGPQLAAQREGHRARDPHPRATLAPSWPSRMSRPGPRRRRSRPARAAGSPGWWPARTARTRSAATTPRRTTRRQPGERRRDAAPTMPASEMRALTLTRVRPRGAAGAPRPPASRRTPWTPRGSPARRGRATVDSVTTALASTQHRNARIAIVAPIAQRRPWLNRSRNGPISGATIANGSIVSPRNSATWPRAWPRRHLEEQRARQRDRHRGVAGGVERVQLDQPEQPESPAPSAWRRAAPGAE